MKNVFIVYLQLACIVNYILATNSDIYHTEFYNHLLSFNLTSGQKNDSELGDFDKLVTNVLLVERMYRKTEEKPDKPVFKEIEDPHFSVGVYNANFRIFHVDFSFLETHFKGANSVCVKRSTPVESIFAYNELTMSKNRLERNGWFMNNCLSVELGIVNFFKSPVNLIWVHPNGKKEIFQERVDPGEKNTYWQNTFIGHHFVIRPAFLKRGENYLEDEIHFNVTEDMIKVIGKQKSQKGKIKGLSDRQIEQHKRQENQRAESVHTNFTSTGFHKVSNHALSQRLWGSIRTFWHNNKENLFEEQWYDRSNYVNWWEVPPMMSVVPFGLKAKWHALLQPSIEEWSGIALEPTDLYGIRIYYNNSWLMNHVDRKTTHVISAIINVEQIDLEEDWQLEAKAHNGETNKISLGAGEALFYESAKVLHGRPTPLNGKSYANVFFHYKPADGPEKWWEADQSTSKDEL